MTHYKPLSQKNWSLYAEMRKLYKEKKITHSQFASAKLCVLETGSLTNLYDSFYLYFKALSNGESKEIVVD